MKSVGEGFRALNMNKCSFFRQIKVFLILCGRHGLNHNNIKTTLRDEFGSREVRYQVRAYGNLMTLDTLMEWIFRLRGKTVTTVIWDKASLEGLREKDFGLRESEKKQVQVK